MSLLDARCSYPWLEPAKTAHGVAGLRLRLWKEITNRLGNLWETPPWCRDSVGQLRDVNTKVRKKQGWCGENTRWERALERKSKNSRPKRGRMERLQTRGSIHYIQMVGDLSKWKIANYRSVCFLASASIKEGKSLITLLFGVRILTKRNASVKISKV